MLSNRKLLKRLCPLAAAVLMIGMLASCVQPAGKTVLNSAEPTLLPTASPLPCASPAPLLSPSPGPGAAPSLSPAPELYTSSNPDPTQTIIVLTTVGRQTPVASVTAAPSPTPVTTPSPNPAAPSATPLPIGIDNYAIPDAIKGQLTTADMAAYDRIISAYMNYENSIEYSADSEIHDLKYLIELCFPIFYSDVDESSIKYEKGRIEWVYTSTKAEHAANIKRFESIISGYISKLYESDSIVMRCLVLYGELIKNVSYDYTTSDYYDGQSPGYDGKLYDHCCDALLHGRGICWCFARSYAYLLNQIGVEALTVCADGGIGHHEWTLFKLDGKWYYADPTWDDPYSVMYFGITANARRSSGYTVQKSRYFAGAYHPIMGVFDVSDERFSDIFTGKCYGDYYVLDRKNNKIIFYNYDDDDIASGEFDLD